MPIQKGDPITAAFLNGLEAQALARPRPAGGMGSPLQIGPNGQQSVQATIPPLLVQAMDDFDEEDPASGPVKAVRFDGTEYATSGEEFTVWSHKERPGQGDTFFVTWNADSGRYEVAAKPLTGEGAGNPPGLPSGSGGCGCSQCVDGTAFHSCGRCGCVNKRRYVAMPEVYPTFGPGELWEELLTIGTLVNEEDCLWPSQEIDGPPCDGYGYGYPVRDKYRLEADIDPEDGPPIAQLVRTEDNGCPLITLKWILCPDCGLKCLCPWVFELAEDGFNNVRPPKECKLCVTPVSRRKKQIWTDLGECGGVPCEVRLSKYAALEIGGTGSAFAGPLNPDSLDTSGFTWDGTYRLVSGSGGSTGCCDVGAADPACWRWRGEEGVTEHPPFYMYTPPGTTDPLSTDLYIVSSHVWAEYVAYGGGLVGLIAYLMVQVDGAPGGGVGHGWQCYGAWRTEPMDCAAFQALIESGTVDLTSYCNLSASPFIADGYARLTLDGAVLIDPPASSSGHPGSNCGGEDTPETDCGGGVQAYLVRIVEDVRSTSTLYSSCDSDGCDSECGADLTTEEYTSIVNAADDWDVFEVACRCGSEVGYQGGFPGTTKSWYRGDGAGGWTLLYASPGCSPSPPGSASVSSEHMAEGGCA